MTSEWMAGRLIEEWANQSLPRGELRRSHPPNWSKERTMDAPFPPGMVEEIEQFLTKVDPTLPPGLDLYPEVFRSNLFFPLQRQEELAEMIREARKVKPRVVMEIGADKGGGLYHWCKCLTTVEVVIACEIRGCPYQHAFNKAFPNIRFAWMERASLPPPNLVEQSIDVLFIDGDKGGMLQDFEAYLPYMDPRGLVFLHDVSDSAGPQEAFKAIGARGYLTRVIHNIRDYINLRDYPTRPTGKSLTPHQNWLLHWKGRSCGVGVIDLASKL